MGNEPNLTRWWPLALVPVAVSLMFAGYGATRDTTGFDWTLPILGVVVGALLFGLTLGYETWRRGRGERDTHTRPMRLAESPVVWLPPILLVAIALTFLFSRQ